MPSLHCHLPPADEKPVPQEEIQFVNETPAVQNNVRVLNGGQVEMGAVDGIDESVDTAQSEANDEASEEYNETDDDDDNGLIDPNDTSSEASSILNDPSIQPYVPEISSTDDDNVSEGGFSTPPSEQDDFEELNVIPVAPVVRGIRGGSRNTARRSRVRSYGQLYARRGRHRQPRREQEVCRLTPFERGLTYNGFARNLKVERITGYKLNNPDEMLYSVKWKNQRGSRYIESSVMRTYRPDLVMDYLESVVAARIPFS